MNNVYITPKNSNIKISTMLTQGTVDIIIEHIFIGYYLAVFCIFTLDLFSAFVVVTFIVYVFILPLKHCDILGNTIFISNILFFS